MSLSEQLLNVPFQIVKAIREAVLKLLENNGKLWTQILIYASEGQQCVEDEFDELVYGELQLEIGPQQRNHRIEECFSVRSLIIYFGQSADIILYTLV
jgi:hypothetical protein